jgi:hypothetical protein
MDLDRILTLEECAEWLRMNRRALAKASKGRCAKIPGIWINERVVRFHPRTILAKRAADSGVSLDTIAAAFSKIISEDATKTPGK